MVHSCCVVEDGLGIINVVFKECLTQENFHAIILS